MTEQRAKYGSDVYVHNNQLYSQSLCIAMHSKSLSIWICAIFNTAMCWLHKETAVSTQLLFRVHCDLILTCTVAVSYCMLCL